MSLARDAQAAGDTVSAENYLQHAEHYNRIVMAAQAQFQQSQPQMREGGEEGYDDRQASGRPRDRFEYNGDGRADGEGEDSEAEGDDRASQGRRSDDQQRQRGSRRERHEARDRQERDEQQQANDPGSEPQPEIAQPAAEASAETEEAPAPAPRRRRSRKAAGGKSESKDETSDGAAALAAFPE